MAVRLEMDDVRAIQSAGERMQGRIQDLGKGGGSDKYIHNWGRVREGACPLP